MQSHVLPGPSAENVEGEKLLDQSWVPITKAH